MEPIFQKHLLFGDIGLRDRQNLVVFLQFTGPVNAFLLCTVYGHVTLSIN